MVLQFLAKHPGCTNADIEAAMADLSGPGEVRQVGGYLIDLVAVNEDERRIRCGTCKRNPDRLHGAIDALQRSAGRFLDAHPRFADWRIEYAAVAPDIGETLRGELQARAVVPQSLRGLTAGL